MKKTDITKEELIALLEEGKTLANIAELYGVGSSTPSRWCKKFGIDYKNTYRKQGYCELDEEKILEMHKTMTAAEIARQLNVNSNRIIKIFRKHNIIAQKTKPKVSYEEIKRLNSEGYTDTQIAEILNRSPKYIMSIVNSLGLQHNKKILDSGELTEMEFQTLLGTLLGDSCLVKRHSYVSGSCAHCIEQEEYIKYKYNLIERLCSNLSKRKAHDDRFKNPDYEYWYFYIKCNKQLDYFYEQFYGTGHKEVTKELINKIEPLGLAIWYMDDGHKYQDYGGYLLCTNAFSDESLKNIQEMFLNKYNIPTSIHCDKAIYILKEGRETFKKLVEPYIVDCMKYKI